MKSRKLWICCLVFVLVAELICNYKAILHRGQNRIVTEGWLPFGLEVLGPAEFAESDGETGGFALQGIEGPVDTLKIDLEVILPDADERLDYLFNSKKQGDSALWVELWGTDAGHAMPYFLGRRMVCHRVEKSLYFTPEFAGDPTSISFYVTDIPEGASIYVHDLALNKPIPFSPSPVRMAFFAMIFALGALLWQYVRTGGTKYRDDKAHRLILCALVAAQIIFVLWEGGLNPKFYHPRGESAVQYQETAHSFMRGELHLGFEAPPVLAEMDNPYDRDLRNRIMEETGQSYRWDTGYYNGRYYMYFGVLPELLYFLPYYAATGNDLETHTAVVISLALYMVGAAFLIRAMVVRLFPDTSIELMGMIYILLTTCSGVLNIASRPEFYALPVVVALYLLMFGLAFWVLSRKKEKELSLGYLAAGSLFIALVAAARPQLCLAAGAGLFIWGDRLIDKKRLFGKRWFMEAAAILSPVVIVAIPLMIYNKLRFGSPTSFGVEYNLTGTDYISRGIRPGRVGHGIFNYLLQTPGTTGVFPFLAVTDANTGYLGERIRGRIYGGQLLCCPVMLLGIYSVIKRKFYHLRRLFLFALFFIALGVLTAALDVQIGIQTRYMSDFAWMFGLATAVALMQGRGESFRKTAVILWFVSIPIFLLRIFCDVSVDGDNIAEMNPVVYSTIEHLVGFWL